MQHMRIATKQALPLNSKKQVSLINYNMEHTNVSVQCFVGPGYSTFQSELPRTYT